MKRVLLILSLVLILAMGLAACSEADTDGEETGAGVETTPVIETTEAVEVVQPTATPVVTEVVEVTPTLAADVTTTETAAEAPSAGIDNSIYRVSNLIGHDIDNTEGNSLGEVDSLIIDRQSGAINYLVVASGGALGIGEKLVAVPWSAFTVNPIAEDDDQRLVINTDQDTLANAPSFDLDALPDVSVNNWDVDIRSYWSSHVQVLPQTGEAAAEGAAGPVRLNDVTDLDIRNAGGEDLGDIEDMILEPQAGQIRYIILAAGGILDVGEKLIPLPWSTLTWGEVEDDDLPVLVLNIEQEQVKNAPGYASWREFPDFTVGGWDADLSGYWGNQ